MGLQFTRCPAPSPSSLLLLSSTGTSAPPLPHGWNDAVGSDTSAMR
jgi:hypothetical protein